MSEQTEVEQSAAIGAFRQWNEAMRQRIDALKTLGMTELVVEMPRLTWAAMKGVNAIEKHGNEALTLGAQGMLGALLSEEMCGPIASWLSDMEDCYARARRLNRPPNMATLIDRIDRLTELMAAPVAIEPGTKQARRVPVPERFGNISQRISFARAETGFAFQYLGAGTIAIPHREDDADVALVENFGAGALHLRRLPDSTPEGGTPVFFNF